MSLAFILILFALILAFIGMIPPLRPYVWLTSNLAIVLIAVALLVGNKLPGS